MSSKKSTNETASRVIEKCGGVAKTASLSGKSVSWVYRWTYKPEFGGTDGRIPRDAQEELLRAASAGKVKITPSDFFEVSA